MAGSWGGQGISSDSNPWRQNLGGHDIIGIDTSSRELIWSGFYEGKAEDLAVSENGETLVVVGNGARDRLGMEETAAYQLSRSLTVE